jgi:hypothetical protein
MYRGQIQSDPATQGHNGFEQISNCDFDLGSQSLAITSQTWTPSYFNDRLISYSAVVTGRASGPIGSGLGVVSFDFGSGGDLNIVSHS